MQKALQTSSWQTQYCFLIATEWLPVNGKSYQAKVHWLWTSFTNAPFPVGKAFLLKPIRINKLKLNPTKVVGPYSPPQGLYTGVHCMLPGASGPQFGTTAIPSPAFYQLWAFLEQYALPSIIYALVTMIRLVHCGTAFGNNMHSAGAVVSVGMNAGSPNMIMGLPLCELC